MDPAWVKLTFNTVIRIKFKGRKRSRKREIWNLACPRAGPLAVLLDGPQSGGRRFLWAVKSPQPLRTGVPS